MNRKAIIIATTIALAGLTACNPVPQVVKHVVANDAPATTTTTTEPPLCPEGQFPVNIGTPNFQCLPIGPVQGVPVVPVRERQPSTPGPLTPAYVLANCPEALSTHPDFAFLGRYCFWVLEGWALNAGWTAPTI